LTETGRRPTVRDVAREGGVSVATVSRAFSGSSDVSAETRRRIVEIADRMGYRHNRMAVDFRRGSTRTIIALVSDITNPFFSEFFKGIEEEARASDYIVLLGDTAGDPESERLYVDMLATGRGDGIILNTAHFPESLRGDVGPVVSCNPVDGLEVGLATVDFALGGRLAAEHLLELGHRRIVQVAGRLDERAVQERYRGFRDALAAVGVETATSDVLQGTLGVPHGLDAAEWIARRIERPSAVFVHNDETALGVLHGLSQLGLRVPEDVSVIGYDDMQFSIATSPALTTIRLPRREWGRLACRTLLAKLQGTSETPPLMVPQLVVRKSTAPI
jgi:LacI family repressor for deo operon, udp, cdd, tsx, nupC, and nupG